MLLILDKKCIDACLPSWTNQSLCTGKHCYVVLLSNATFGISGRFSSKFQCLSCNMSSFVCEQITLSGNAY
jgi:hypothetical protein